MEKRYVFKEVMVFVITIIITSYLKSAVINTGIIPDDNLLLDFVTWMILYTIVSLILRMILKLFNGKEQ